MNILKLVDLRIENQINPIGLSEQNPRFSWKLKSLNKNTVQKGYSLVVKKGSEEVWNSGEQESSQSVHVEYEGKELEPSSLYTVEVKAWDNHKEESYISGSFETDLLSYRNIQADWIASPENEIEALPVFVRRFELDKEVSLARVYVSSLGIYEIELNGEKVGKEYFSPGWTNYKERIQYQTYDITKQVAKENKIELTVANGWYKGILGFDLKANRYGDRLAAIAEVHLTFTDGTKEIIRTGKDWKVKEGKTRYAELYMGETIDHTVKDNEEKNAVVYEYDKSILIGQENEPVRITEKLNVIKKIETPKGETVLDFGQNITGVVELVTKQDKGKEIVIRHAEVLDKDGNFYPDTLREAISIDRFTCSGEQDTFRPRFTFHGFRYIAVEGLSYEEVIPEEFTACVMHSDMKQTGEFETSHKAVTQLQRNIQWGQRDNFLDIPTDCPQRDERLGWTGDAQVFARTAAFNYDVTLFFRKWLRDLKSEQTKEKGVPHVIPDILGIKEGAAAWSDAAVIIPWTMYQMYGDKRVLEEQYDSMKDWVDYMHAQSGDNCLWQTGFQYGDWLALDKEEISMGRTGSTDVYLIASAYFAYSTSLFIKVAEVLNRSEDIEKYRSLYERIKANFNKEYITTTGRIVSDTQTAAVVALHFDLVEEKYRERVLSTLVDKLGKFKNHLTTGFVGTPYIAHVLSNNGKHEMAGELLLKEDFPSWLYSVKMGATTIWERWNSIHFDGTFDESGMNSLNHYAYGSIGDWMYQQLGGLQIINPGYKKSRIAPRFIKGITSAKASLETPYGMLSCKWECVDKQINITIQIPENTTAVLNLPEKEEEIEVGSGFYEYTYVTETVLELERYSLDSTLGEILQQSLAVEMLEKMSPGMTDAPMIQFAYEQTINELLTHMPPEGVEMFQIVITELNKVEREALQK